MARRRGLDTLSAGAKKILEYLLDPDFLRKIDVENIEEETARDILVARSRGKASEINDLDMAVADDRFMYDYTPLDMSTPARMKRAEDANFQELYYHGTDKPYLEEVSDFGFFGSKNPAVAETYLGKRQGQQGIIPFMVKMPEKPVHFDNQGRFFEQINPYALDKTSGKSLDEIFTIGMEPVKEGVLQKLNVHYGDVQPLKVDPSEVAHIPKGFQDNYFLDTPEGLVSVGNPTSTDLIAEVMNVTDNPVVKIDNIIDIGGNIPTAKEYQRMRREPASNVIVSEGSRVRSPFARFDPEFSHLRNISASVAAGAIPASVGMAQLLQKPEVTKEEIEEYLSGLGS